MYLVNYCFEFLKSFDNPDSTKKVEEVSPKKKVVWILGGDDLINKN